MIRKDDIPSGTNSDGWTDPVPLKQGYSVRVKVEYDEHADAPWDMSDGCGPVSDWRSKASKAPGERVLAEDHGRARFYDFAAAVKLARKDGWGAEGDAGMKPGEKAAHAAEKDFEFLRGWCTDQWHYVVVGVEVSRNGAVLYMDYCGGIENLGDYWREFAADHANCVIETNIKAHRTAAIAARKETIERRRWEARDVVTA
jgi:hypothetical protein